MTGYQGPKLGSWVQKKGGTLVGRAIGFDLRTNEYIVVVPPKGERSGLRLRLKAWTVIEIEGPNV